MSIKSRLEKLETKSGSTAPYILVLKRGMTEDEAMAAYLAETGKPLTMRDLV